MNNISVWIRITRFCVKFLIFLFVFLKLNRRLYCKVEVPHFVHPYTRCGAWGGVVVKALRYLSDGPGIDSRWCQWGFFPWYPRQNNVP